MLLAVGALLTPGTALAQEPAGEGSPNLSLTQNLPYPAIEKNFAKGSEVANYGTDIEFAKLRGKEYAFAGSYKNGLQIFDISKPSKTKRAQVYDCSVTQGDVQVFRQADERGRTFVAYTSDTFGNVDSDCYREAAAKGFAVRKSASTAQGANNGKNGTFIIDVTNPKKPFTVSFVEFPLGSHNMTVHPSGDFLYNSNSELITNLTPAIEVFDISNLRAPKKAGDLKLDARPGLGTNSHDITFNESGTRAYSAALSHGVVIDTSKPGAPKITSTFDDEAVNVWHQVDPVTLRAKNGSKREILIAEDEFAGAAGGPVCPSGGVHVYDVTGDKEKAPEKLGYWNITDFAGPTHDATGTCTAHVFDIHEDQQLMTIAFYNGGVRVVDLSKLADGGPMEAIASYKTENADSWSFKAPRVSRNGVFYAFGNDIERGLDVYRYDGRQAKSKAPGAWLPGPALEVPTGQRSGVSLPQVKTGASAPASLAGYRMRCMLPQQ